MYVVFLELIILLMNRIFPTFILCSKRCSDVVLCDITPRQYSECAFLERGPLISLKLPKSLSQKLTLA